MKEYLILFSLLGMLYCQYLNKPFSVCVSEKDLDIKCACMHVHIWTLVLCIPAYTGGGLDADTMS